MTPRHLRFIVAVALFAFLFLFFVPIFYDATMFQCADPRSLCLSDPSGLKSIAYALFHWGGVYSFVGQGDPELGGYGFRGSSSLSDANQVSSFVIVVLLALPLATVDAGLLEPEIVRKFRPAAVGFVVLGLLDFVLASGSFSLGYQERSLMFDLIGAAVSLSGVVMILYLYNAGCFSRA